MGWRLRGTKGAKGTLPSQSCRPVSGAQPSKEVVKSLGAWVRVLTSPLPATDTPSFSAGKTGVNDQGHPSQARPRITEALWVKCFVQEMSGVSVP